MKLFYTIASCVLAASPLVQAEATPECSQCNVKARAAALMGQSAKLASVNYKVTGIKDAAAAKQLKAALAAIDGAVVEKVCHSSGCAVVNFDAKKTSKEAIQKAITSKGYAVSGERVSIAVSGMTCGGCSGKVTRALAKLDGCSDAKVSHKDGSAAVTIDPKKVTRAQVEAAITATGFKVTQ